jgi:hypothetical protein
MKSINRKSIKKSNISKKESLKELLLRGPVMSKSQYDEYKAIRKHFDKWRGK